MNVVKKFIKTLCEINLISHPQNMVDIIYEELEILDMDLYEEEIKKCIVLPFDVRIKIINLIEFYYLKVEECINNHSYKECYEFLKELKTKAEEISLYIL